MRTHRSARCQAASAGPVRCGGPASAAKRPVEHSAVARLEPPAWNRGGQRQGEARPISTAIRWATVSGPPTGVCAAIPSGLGFQGGSRFGSGAACPFAEGWASAATEPRSQRSGKNQKAAKMAKPAQPCGFNAQAGRPCAACATARPTSRARTKINITGIAAVASRQAARQSRRGMKGRARGRAERRRAASAAETATGRPPPLAARRGHAR